MVPVTVPLLLAVPMVMEYVPLSVEFVGVLAAMEKTAGIVPPVVEPSTILPSALMVPVMLGLITPNGNAQGMPFAPMHSGKASWTQAMPDRVLPDCVR